MVDIFLVVDQDGPSQDDALTASSSVVLRTFVIVLGGVSFFTMQPPSCQKAYIFMKGKNTVQRCEQNQRLLTTYKIPFSNEGVYRFNTRGVTRLALFLCLSFDFPLT